MMMSDTNVISTKRTKKIENSSWEARIFNGTDVIITSRSKKIDNSLWMQ
jgi:hypothetical protein